MKRNAGFTLIEILIVVAIIGVMLAVAVVSVASGRDATRARAAARGVAQMSHYANALAILRQRAAVISFSGNKISVQLSGQGVDTSEIGETTDPIYREVNVDGKTVVTLPSEEMENEEPAAEADAKQEKEAGYLDQGITPDIDDFSKEDAERTFEGVLFRVELVDENGQALDATTATQLRSEANAMVAKREPAGAAWSNTSGEIDLGETDDDLEKPEVRPENEGRVIYESNGSCAPYRVIIFATTEDNQEGEELMSVNVSRSGKVTIGDEEETNRR